MAKHPQKSQKSKKAQQASKSAKPSGDKKLDRLFSAVESSQPSHHLLGSTVLFDLLLVRPWILVGSFWLILMLTIAIAFGGLTNPGKKTVQVTAESEVVSQDGSVMPDAAASSRLDLQADRSQLADPAATLQGTPEQPVPVWPLWVMVLACAGGCLMMSQQGIAAPRLQRGRSRRATGGGGPKIPGATAKVKSMNMSAAQAKASKGDTAKATPQTKSAKAKPTQNRRSRAARRRLKPQYPSAQVMAVQSTDRSIQRVTPTRAQSLMPTAEGAKPVSFAMKSTPVTVVPSRDSHPLDWRDGSLAHNLDVRAKRPLNSLL